MGRTAEEVIARLMMQVEWRVVPTYNYSGEDGKKAPKALAIGGPAYVLPDLQLLRDGQVRWVEVKTKAKPLQWRNPQRKEHGVEERHFLDYIEIQRVSGAPVYICIFEQNSGEVLISPIDTLMGWERRGRLHGHYGPWMVNWPRSYFSPFDATDFFPVGVRGNKLPRALADGRVPVGQYRLSL